MNYDFLGERERLDLIRKGNDDVYNYEKNKNAKYKGELIISGLPTTRADEWEATIDNAYKVSQKNARKAVTPRYGSARLGELNRALSASIKDLKKQRDESLDTAYSDSEAALDYIKEWLASNGYSDSGKLATMSKKELGEALENVLENIRNEYDSNLKSIRNKFLSMAQ